MIDFHVFTDNYGTDIFLTTKFCLVNISIMILCVCVGGGQSLYNVFVPIIINIIWFFCMMHDAGRFEKYVYT